MRDDAMTLKRPESDRGIPRGIPRWLIGLAFASACMMLQPGRAADAQPGGAPALPSRIPFPFPAPRTAATPPTAAPATAATPSSGVRVSRPAQLNETPLAGTTLRFENADIYEVVQVILGDILHLSYLIDPAIQGKITLNTQETVSTADVYGILESVLRLHNISIVREGRLHKVLRDASATRDAIGFEAAGENSPLIQVVPLKFVQASALVNVLRNFVGPQGAITNDATNRYLVLADRASNVAKLIAMVASLDVDYLQHIRVRIVQITKGDAAELAREMDALFRSSGLFNWPGTDGNKVFFMPVARMNAILGGHIDLTDANMTQKGKVEAGQLKFIAIATGWPGSDFVGTGRTAYVWEPQTGKTITEFAGHSDAVSDAAFSPDSQRVVTASADHTAQVWEAATGKAIAVLSGHTGNVYSAVFSPDGKWIVTASSDNTARVWEAATGKVVSVLQGHTGFVQSATFSPDGKFVVTASRDNTARVWDAATGTMLTELSGHEAAVNEAVFSPDQK